MNRIARLLQPESSTPLIELKPCPFCGGPAELLHLDSETCFAVQCANFEDGPDRRNICDVYTCAGPCETAADAAQAWNHRGSSSNAH